MHCQWNQDKHVWCWFQGPNPEFKKHTEFWFWLLPNLSSLLSVGPHFLFLCLSSLCLLLTSPFFKLVITFLSWVSISVSFSLSLSVFTLLVCVCVCVILISSVSGGFYSSGSELEWNLKIHFISLEISNLVSGWKVKDFRMKQWKCISDHYKLIIMYYSFFHCKEFPLRRQENDTLTTHTPTTHTPTTHTHTYYTHLLHIPTTHTYYTHLLHTLTTHTYYTHLLHTLTMAFSSLVCVCLCVCVCVCTYPLSVVHIVGIVLFCV